MAGTATTSMIVITKLLPTRFRRVFTRAVLDVVMAIFARPQGAAEFVPEGKSFKQVVAASKGLLSSFCDLVSVPALLRLQANSGPSAACISQGRVA